MHKEIVKKAMSQKEYDEVKLNRYLVLLLLMDSAMSDVMYDLSNAFKIKGLYRMEIKQNVKAIYKKLESNPKNTWVNIDKERMLAFDKDADHFLDMCYRFVQLDTRPQVTVLPDYGVGERVWTYDDDSKPILCEVDAYNVNLRLWETDGKKQGNDDSYYELKVLDKNMKPTGRVIERDEEDIYKHLKDMQNENTEVQ